MSAPTPVITTDTSGNRVETVEYKDTSGNTVTEVTTDYGEIGFSTLFSSGISYFFIIIYSLLFGALGFILYWLFSKGGKIGYGIFGTLCLASLIYAIYRLATLDRKNIVKAVTSGVTTSYTGNFEITIYSGFQFQMSSILVNSLYAYLSFKNAFVTAPTNTNITTQAGGKRKKTQRK